MFFFLILLGMLGGDAAWWYASDRLARRTARPTVWRRVARGFVGLMALGLILLLAARLLYMRRMIMPELAVIAVFIWHFILMPLFVLPVLVVWLAGRAWGVVRKPPVIEPDLIDPSAEAMAEPVAVGTAPPVTSRRAFLSAAVLTLPPLATVALTGQSSLTEDDLRLREIDLPIPNLPRGLDGLTIAHVTDPHLGSFIRDAKIRKIIAMTNDLDADLVLQTGDLINASLDDLPDGIELTRKLHARYGVYSCQGNHDRIDDADAFEADALRAGLNLLLDESRVITVRNTKIRLMAPRWWGTKEASLRASVRQILPPANDDAFPILLAHHPHCFDAAAEAGLPLTLSGHTHGGQLALTQNVGVGPLVYRYWSGVYTKGPSTCVVSNGTGNWFPLRINVPCEILKLTLRCV